MLRAIIGLLVFALCPSTQTASSQKGVQLAVHHAPVVVRILGAPHLVHELWIESRLELPTTVTAVTVLDADRPLVSYRGPTLLPHIGRPGLPRNHPTPLILDPGQSAVVYFWVPLAPGTMPQRVQHRVVLTPRGSSSLSREIVVDGGAASVSSPDDAEILDAPLRGAGWAAVYDPTMMGGHRTALYTVDGNVHIPGRFAIDLIRLLPSGRAHTDRMTTPDDWNGFGAEVLAVKDATVAAAVDGRRDADAAGKPREVVARDNAAGNYIALDLGSGRFAFYEHLQQGSVGVKVGDRVVRGQVIARIGSSGSVSSGPHLHFHVSDGNSLLGAEGLPFVFRRFTHRGAFASIEAFVNGDAPASSRSGVDPARQLERPAANAVIDLPDRR